MSNNAWASKRYQIWPGETLNIQMFIQAWSNLLEATYTDAKQAAAMGGGRMRVGKSQLSAWAQVCSSRLNPCLTCSLSHLITRQCSSTSAGTDYLWLTDLPFGMEHQLLVTVWKAVKQSKLSICRPKKAALEGKRLFGVNYARVNASKEGFLHMERWNNTM